MKSKKCMIHEAILSKYGLTYYINIHIYNICCCLNSSFDGLMQLRRGLVTTRELSNSWCPLMIICQWDFDS